MHQLLYSKIVQLYQFPYKLGVCKGHRHAKGHRLQFCQFFLEKVLSWRWCYPCLCHLSVSLEYTAFLFFLYTSFFFFIVPYRMLENSFKLILPICCRSLLLFLFCFCGVLEDHRLSSTKFSISFIAAIQNRGTKQFYSWVLVYCSACTFLPWIPLWDILWELWFEICFPSIGCFCAEEPEFLVWSWRGEGLLFLKVLIRDLYSQNDLSPVPPIILFSPSVLTNWNLERLLG